MSGHSCPLASQAGIPGPAPPRRVTITGSQLRRRASDGTKQQAQCFSDMIEIAMYIGIGVLTGCLIAVAVVPLVHDRAVRLTVRRVEAALPQSIDEIRADKDLLRADFAMSTRRMEITIEQLRNKAASQLIELDRRADVVNRLKAQRDRLKVELICATAEAQVLKKQLAEPRRRAERKSDVRALLRRWMPHSVYH